MIVSMSAFWRMLHFVQIFPSFGTSVSSGDTAAVRKARNSSTISVPIPSLSSR